MRKLAIIVLLMGSQLASAASAEQLEQIESLHRSGDYQAAIACRSRALRLGRVW